MKRTTTFIPKMTSQDKNRINELNNLFFENDHEYLKTKTLPIKIKNEIQSLYYKYFNKVDNHDWSKSLIDLELDNLKKDTFCNKNKNKIAWSMTIILSWLSNLPNNITEKDLYFTLDSREANQRVIKFAYWQ